MLNSDCSYIFNKGEARDLYIYIYINSKFETSIFNNYIQEWKI